MSMTFKQMEEKFGVSQATISLIAKKKGIEPDGSTMNGRFTVKTFDEKLVGSAILEYYEDRMVRLDKEKEEVVEKISSLKAII